MSRFYFFLIKVIFRNRQTRLSLPKGNHVVTSRYVRLSSAALPRTPQYLPRLIHHFSLPPSEAAVI
jgi:hypothetical protein